MQEELVGKKMYNSVIPFGVGFFSSQIVILPHLSPPRIKLHILSLVVICSTSNVGSCLCQELGLSARQDLIIKDDIHLLVREFL